MHAPARCGAQTRSSAGNLASLTDGNSGGRINLAIRDASTQIAVVSLFQIHRPDRKTINTTSIMEYG
jgi:hypothetical protein